MYHVDWGPLQSEDTVLLGCSPQGGELACQHLFVSKIVFASIPIVVIEGNRF